MQVVPQSPGLSAKPGKNWRRSLAAAKRDSLATTNSGLATSRLSMMPSSGSLSTRSSFYMVPTKVSTGAARLPGSPKVQDKVSKLLEGLLEEEAGSEEERINQSEVEESMDEVGLKSHEEELLAVCSGGKVVKFDEVYNEEVMEGAVKVGEGAFGEVFRVGTKEGASVLKIIPFGGDIDINQEKQTTVEDIISEVKSDKCK